MKEFKEKDKSTIGLYLTNPHPCSYLPQQQATSLFVDPAADIEIPVYDLLSQQGFRRSGEYFYRPNCNDCCACIAVRIPVDQFKPNRNQRRCREKHRNLTVTITASPDFDTHYPLYENYIRTRHHDGDMFPPSQEQYLRFIANGREETRYIEFREDKRLVCCAVTDTLHSGLSAVYTYFDPDLTAYSFGRNAVLYQIELARELGLPYLYLGYWIETSTKMAYKAEYQPQEHFWGNSWKTTRQAGT